MRLRLSVLLLLVMSAWLFSASAFSGGPPADTVKNNDGCTCHGASNSATVIHDVKGWPSTYVPNQQYILEVTSTNNVQPKPALEQNQGGFLAWVSKGEFTTTPGTQAWIDVGQMSSGEHWARHNIQGEKENGQQKWNFTWTAPADGEGSVTIHVYVNRINSNQQNSGDHWNKRQFTATEGSGDPTSVFPTPSHLTSSEPAPTTSDATTSTTPITQDVGGQGEPAPGFVIGAAVILAAAVVVRRRFR